MFINDGRDRTISFKNDLNGQVIRRDETDNNGSNGDPHEVRYRFNGVELAMIGNNGTTDVDYASSLAMRTATPGTGAFRGGALFGSSFSDLHGGPDAINSFRQGSASGRYTVQGGETLQGIAQQVWGDASLWYKLAEANGLSADAMLAEGHTIPGTQYGLR